MARGCNLVYCDYRMIYRLMIMMMSTNRGLERTADGRCGLWVATCYEYGGEYDLKLWQDWKRVKRMA